MSELDRYLASEAAQGLFLEEGRFLLDPDKALVKLGKFGLPDPGFWVLKLVQAAVAAGAPEIKFNFERKRVTVRFPNQANWEADQILETLLRGTTPADSPLRHLIAGLLGAAMGFSQKITWRCGAHFVTVTKTGPGLEETCQRDNLVVITATRPTTPAFHLGSVTTPVRYLFRQTAHEYKALVDRCCVCPIPVVVDGYELSCSYQTSIEELPRIKGADLDKSDGRGKLLAQLPLFELGRPALPYPIDKEPLTSGDDLRETLPSLRLAAEDATTQGVVCVYSCLQRQSRLSFVMDGILLHSALLSDYPEFDRFPSILENGIDDFILDLYLPVSWTDLDLTGFKVRPDNLGLVAEATRKALSEAFEIVRSHCQLPWNLSSNPPHKKLPWSPSIAEILATVVVSAAFLPFVPQILVMGGTLLIAKPVHSALKRTAFAEKFNAKRHAREAEQLSARLAKIIDALADSC